MPKKQRKVGLWMIGACGSVGGTVALGVAALRKKLAATCGLVTELPPFRRVELVDPGSLVIGGHEIRSTTLSAAIKSLHKRAGLFDPDVIRSCSSQLRSMQRRIRPGTLCGAATTIRKLGDSASYVDDKCPADAVARLSADIGKFRDANKLDDVIVIHVASSEPRIRRSSSHSSFKELRRAMARKGASVLPPSSIYALAAIEARSAFINFTPSTGVSVPAIAERAAELDVPYMGNDGKTGETLVKSVLAPLFAMRNLPVLSWVGQNILGNNDGAVLKDPNTRAGKLQSKDRTVSRILGRNTETRVSIDFVPSLDDWKVAWDFIHFEGFLGTKMNMQFTWQGSDSILAAPLIIDLTRLAALESQAQRGGPMRHLAYFFKDPIGITEQNLFSQWGMLIDHVANADHSVKSIRQKSGGS